MFAMYSNKLVIHALCKYLDSFRIFYLVSRPITPDKPSRGAKVRAADGSAKHYKSQAFGELCTKEPLNVQQ